jgi:hypothetical protein
MTIAALSGTLGRTAVRFTRSGRQYVVLVDPRNCVWEFEVDGERRVMCIPENDVSRIAARMITRERAALSTWAESDSRDHLSFFGRPA